MKIKFLFSLVILTLAFTGLSCTDDNGVAYENQHDPFSSNYEPGAPDSLTAVVQADSGIEISWKSSSLREDGFRIFRKDGFYQDFKKIAEVPARTTTYFDRLRIKPGVDYYYQVASFTNNIRSSYSKETSVRFEFSPPALILKEANSNSVTIAWDKPNDLAEHYVLERSVDGGQFAQVAYLNSDVFSYTDAELNRQNTYCYRIKALAQNAGSEYSKVLQLGYTLSDLRKIKSVDLGNPVHSIAFSPDGTRLAAAGMSYSVRVWNVSDGALLWDLGYKGTDISSPGYPFQVAFSGSGSLLAASADPNTTNTIIKVWHMSDGSLAHSIPGSDAIRSICFSRDENKIYAGNLNGEVNTWNLADAKFIGKKHIANGSGYIPFLYSTHDGEKVITGVMGFPSPLKQGVQIWGSGSWWNFANFQGFDSEYYAISNDENFFAYNGTVAYLSTGETAAVLHGYYNGQECFNSDDQILLGRFYSGGLTATLISNEKVNVSKAVPLPVNNNYPVIAASSRSELFAIAGEQKGIIEFWEIVRGWRSIL